MVDRRVIGEAGARSGAATRTSRAPSHDTSMPPSSPYIMCLLFSGSIQIAWLSTWPLRCSIDEHRLAAVDRLLRVHAADVDRVRVVRIDANLAEVHRPLVLVVHERPRLAVVDRLPDASRLRIRRATLTATAARPPHRRRAPAAPAQPRTRAPAPRQPPGSATAPAAYHHARRVRRRRIGAGAAAAGAARLFLVLRDFDLCVEDVRVRLADVERDAAERAVRQAVARLLLPRLAAVDRLVEAAARAAADESPRGAPALYIAAQRFMRIRRVDDDLCRARVLVDVERLRPRLAAVGRHEDAALRIRSVEVPTDRRSRRVRVLRVHDDAAERLRIRRDVELRERRAGVGALVEPVAVRRRLAVVRFAGRRRRGCWDRTAPGAMSAMDAEPYVLKIGSNVVPLFTVFHTPATA